MNLLVLGDEEDDTAAGSPAGKTFGAPARPPSVHPPASLSRGLVVLFVASLAAAAPMVGLVVATPAAPPLQVDEPTPVNDTTRHEDPGAAGGDGDLAAVRGWLGGRMAVRLESCVVDVGTGATDVCALEDEYPEWLGKYVDVADDTREETDDRMGESFGSASDDAETYAETVASFRETHREYRDAREAGDEARARELARQLQRDGAAVVRTSDDLRGQFRTLEDVGGVDLADGRESLNATEANVTATVEEVEREQFVPTALAAELRPRTVSFLEPGTVTGRLTAENGSPVADRRIELRVGERVLSTRTDGSGAFSLAYRPTTIPASTESLTVRYRPRNASAYLASETTVPVAVTPVAPDVTVEARPSTVGFGDAVTVSGRVAAGGVGAPGVPVVVALDGRRLGEVRTDASGAFELTGAVGATDGPGSVAVGATMPLSGRALASTDGAATVTVETTATALGVDAAADGPASVAVEGALRTADGRAVPDQPVAVRVEGTTVETLRTGGDGAFRGTATVPSSLHSGESPTVRVVAAYGGGGTNLGPSNASAVVTLPAGGAGASGGDGGGVLSRPVGWVPGEPAVWQLLGLVGLAALLALGWVLRQRGFRPGGVGAPAGRPDDDESAPTPDPSPSAGEQPTPLEAARERLAGDPDGAVLLAYAAVRRALAGAGAPGRSRADTHWEFLAACADDGLDAAAVDGLTRLTEAYERAAYAPSSVSADAAASALEAADGLV